MRVLLCHNFYQQPGGEDRVFFDEARLLRAGGHDVELFTVHNDAIESMSRMSVAAKTIYNRDIAARLHDSIRRFQPDVMHCTNTFPLISPAAYFVARRSGVAVVQALHNYRLLCPGAYLMRDGRVCEDCLCRRIKWPAVKHKCYRDSRAASFVVASMLMGHSMFGTWRRMVDCYYALTEFGRKKFIQGGFAPNRLRVKPNFVDPDPGSGDGDGGYAVFVGRLSLEKGVRVLLDAWREMPKSIPLKIVGDGPLADEVARASAKIPAIEWVGVQDQEGVRSIVGQATCLILPSLWYEGFPKTIVEAFAVGTPVVASRLGAMEELIESGRTGWLFPSGDAEALRQLSKDIFAKGRDWSDFRRAARIEFTTKYSAERNLPLLLDIYRDAMAAFDRSSAGRPAGRISFDNFESKAVRKGRESVPPITDVGMLSKTPARAILSSEQRPTSNPQTTDMSVVRGP